MSLRSFPFIVSLVHFDSGRSYRYSLLVLKNDSMSILPKYLSSVSAGVDVPAIITELKKDDAVESAIDQIKERKYSEVLEKYKDNLLLVAISYDSKTKEHFYRIEKA